MTTKKKTLLQQNKEGKTKPNQTKPSSGYIIIIYWYCCVIRPILFRLLFYFILYISVFNACFIDFANSS